MSLVLRLGASRLGTPLIWENAANSHIYVSGQSGQGKSFFLRHCAAQLPEQGVRCVVFDYTGDLRRFAEGGTAAGETPCSCLDVRTQVGIDPFRPLPLQREHPEQPSDIAARIAELILSSYSARGGTQQLRLRDALERFIARGNTRSGFSGLADQIRRSGSARDMAATLLRLQDLAKLLPGASRTFSWNLNSPGITVLRFGALPDLFSQAAVTQFLLLDLWGEKLSLGAAGCPAVAVLDECQRFRFAENSIFTRILREGRKLQFSGWFASQWIDDRAAAAALAQAALQVCFYPGADRISAMARRLAHDGLPPETYKKLLQGLAVGEYLYKAARGRPIVGRVPPPPPGPENAK